MSAIPYLDADAVRSAAPMEALLDAIETAYRDVAAGRDRSPLRAHVALGDGDLLLMPGVRIGGGGATVKVVTIVPRNADRGRPTVQAIVVWIDAETGTPLALLDGATLTAMRTGAASGVATRLLARPDSATLGLLGAGAQAEWQVRAVAAVLPLERVLVHAPSEARRTAFAQRLSHEMDLDVVPVHSAREAVEAADVVCCATTSSTPVFEADWLRPGTHVNGIGAFRLGMVELPPACFRRATLVAVDSREAAMAEAGDVVAAIDAGLLAAEDLVEIGSLARSWVAARDPDAITVFKSVGLAIQDVAAAELVVRRALGAPEGG